MLTQSHKSILVHLIALEARPLLNLFETHASLRLGSSRDRYSSDRGVIGRASLTRGNQPRRNSVDFGLGLRLTDEAVAPHPRAHQIRPSRRTPHRRRHVGITAFARFARVTILLDP